MKAILKTLFTLVVVLFIAAIAFYFWAKSAVLSEEAYNQEISYDVILPEKNDSLITVMTYNLGYLSGMTNNLAVRPSRDFYKKNEEKILQLLSQTHPDLVGFQEIDYGSQRSYDVNQHEYIAKGLYPYTVQAVNWDKRYVPFPYYPPKVHFGRVLSGQSIMSKFPLEKSERIVLQEVASQPFYYKAVYLNRLLQTVKVNCPLKMITFMNVHAEAFDQETRQAHLDYVYAKFWEAAAEGAVILVGDFNSDPGYKDSAVAHFLNDRRIGSAAVEQGQGAVMQVPKTYPSDMPKERLDYIFFTTKDFELINSKILTEYGQVSDHLPCMATLRVK